MTDKYSTRPRAWGIYLVLGSLVAFEFFLLSEPKLRFFYEIFYDFLDISAVVTIVVGMCMNRPERSLLWYLLAFGQLIFVAGAFTLNFFKNVLHIEAPFPSMFDAFWSSGYPILTAGLVLLILGCSDERMRCVFRVISEHRNPLERS